MSYESQCARYEVGRFGADACIAAAALAFRGVQVEAPATVEAVAAEPVVEVAEATMPVTEVL